MNEPSNQPVGSTTGDGKPEREIVKRAILPIIDRQFQFRVTLLVVGIITLTHLLAGGYIYFEVAAFGRKLADFVPDLEPDALSFRMWVRNLMALTLVSTFLTIILLSLYFSSRISGPLYNMARVFQEFGLGDYSKRIHLRKGDELKHLSDAANQMFEQVSARQRQTQENLEKLQSGVEAGASKTDLLAQIKNLRNVL